MNWTRRSNSIMVEYGVLAAVVVAFRYSKEGKI
jgi:hypothetical protein